ncbi:MAG TPA: S9 family peptidase [Methylomirabilota bacterium]|nr:S9 family peptidase [Methylomirabilota bacterium]
MHRSPVAPAVLLALALLVPGPIAGAAAGATAPPLIPRAVLFGNATRGFPQLSPDGRRVSWLAPDAGGVQNVWVQGASGDSAKPITHETHRPIYFYRWAADSRHLLYLQDGDGDENNHLFSADLESGVVRDLTPFRGVRAQNVLVSKEHPNAVLAGLNLRDRRFFDMHRVDLETGAVTLEAKNPGDVLTWTTDWDFVIRAATAFDPRTCNTIIRVRDAADQPWRDLVTMPFEQALFDGQVVNGSLIAAFGPDNKSLVIHSALGGNYGRLVRVDGDTGKELEVLASHPTSDVASDALHPGVMLDPAKRRVVAVAFDAGEPEWKFLDSDLAADFAKLAKTAPGHADIVSSDSANRRWVVVISRSDAPDRYVRYDRGTGAVEPLYTLRPELEHVALAPKQVVSIPARDGLKLVSYLTLPPDVPAKKLPLVLLVHGGPWVRDHADFDPEVQLLANRGYAVLQVNYRGSTGFGLKYLNSSTHEWGRGTQQDLYDAVKWALAQGIADPKRVACFGWSGGGYATLMALWQQPQMFTCGVDGVGPGDLRTLFGSFPTYWDGILARWRRRVGDVENDDAFNRERSPIYHVDAIRSPLLVGQGANDPRVKLKTADAMVKALRDAGREVTYVVYPDEGHGFRRPENQLDFYGRVEEFLAKHLGGRAESWAKMDGATAELK